KNVAQQCALAAAHVYQRAESREVIGSEQGGAGPANALAHNCIEDRSVVLMRREIVEKALTENPLKGWLTGANGFMQLSKGTPKKGGWQEQGGGPLRLRVIRTEPSLRGVLQNRPSGVMAKTPRVLRARNRHSSEGGCAPESLASSATLLGPE